jgi:hypothetical protein
MWLEELSSFTLEVHHEMCVIYHNFDARIALFVSSLSRLAMITHTGSEALYIMSHHERHFLDCFHYQRKSFDAFGLA